MCLGHQIRLIPPNEYPFLLRQLTKPPEKMYICGELPSDDHKFLCVIGSRANSQYGRDVCREIIHGLRGSPVVIVSGLAIGMDSLAHEFALEVGLKTIAVPGSGLDESVLYPRSKHSLARRILEAGGALLSPFDLNRGSAKWTFIARNAVMAGLSHAILIIEGRKDSGTMITAGNASEFSRDLLVVPGSIFSDLSYVPNSRLRDGGLAVTCAEDVLEALGLSAECSSGQSGSERAISELGVNEKRLLKCLSYPKMRDELIAEMGIGAPELGALLGGLELLGAISDQDGMIAKMWNVGREARGAGCEKINED